MSIVSKDQEIVAMLAKKLGVEIDKAVYDDEGCLITLSLAGLSLTQLPPEIGLLSHLQELDLRQNQLGELPLEIRQLKSLRTLILHRNQLSNLPPEIVQLNNLQKLDVDSNRMTIFPREILQLMSLNTLFIDNNQLREVPSKIGCLLRLQMLTLNKNELKELPRELGQLGNLQRLWVSENKLKELPRELGQLSNLRVLNVHENELKELPRELGQLSNLRVLDVHENELKKLPRELGQLSRLQVLYVRGNGLKELPRELGQLSRLRVLSAGRCRLSKLPGELGQLSNLQKLWVSENELKELPVGIMQLHNLQELDLNNNLLTKLPIEMSQLRNLRKLDLSNNPSLLTPPPEIVARGTKAILGFLQELQKNRFTRYEAKLLLVGEGGTGKSSLLRALHNNQFNPHLSTTHGIEVDRLELAHPDHMTTLNTWDFGGQHIYHATHQFFLTKRSLYLVVWNARLGAEQGRLHYWLETIKALAPDAPVLLVATHIDERGSDLNYQLYKDAYPQLVGSLNISNQDGSGIAELKARLLEEAERLPLMGQPWPRTWLDVENALLARPEQYIDANEYVHCCTRCGTEEEIVKGTLGNYLHDLGKILYFRDDYVLSNLVVLKPNWVTRAISLVLDDKATDAAKGILPHSELARIWSCDEAGQLYAPYLYPIFLRLMERFELSYQIEADLPGEHPTSSLIPLLLPHQPPADLPAWPEASASRSIAGRDGVPSRSDPRWHYEPLYRAYASLHEKAALARRRYVGVSGTPGQSRTQSVIARAAFNRAGIIAAELLYYPHEYCGRDPGALRRSDR